MIVLSAIKLHCKSGIVVNLNIYACLGKVIVRQTPFAVKLQHPGSDLFEKKKKFKKETEKKKNREREKEQEGKRLCKVSGTAKILGLEVIRMCQKESLFCGLSSKLLEFAILELLCELAFWSLLSLVLKVEERSSVRKLIGSTEFSETI